MRMKMGLLFMTGLILSAWAYVPAYAENTWQNLVTSLPALEQIDGFVKEEVEGDNDQLPYASVLYTRAGTGDISEDQSDPGNTIVITITDCAGAGEYLASMIEINPHLDQPTRIGAKFPGKKTIEQNESGIHSCGYTFVVAERYLIELSSSGKGDFFSQMDALINAMNLERLI